MTTAPGPGPGASGAVPPGRVAAVVPLRDGVSGKSRLAASLDPGARRRLVVALARHVLGVLAASPDVSRVCVVTADVAFVREVLGGLPDLGGRSSTDRQSGLPVGRQPADVIREPAGRPGLNAALDHAREHVRSAAPHADRLLVVHADLPALTTDDVAAVLAGPSDVVIATDRHHAGTNLLALPLASCQDEHAVSPAEGLTHHAELSFRFGPGSRAAHEAEAASRGRTSAVVHRAGTAADLDTIDDWDELPTDVRERVRGTVGTDLP